MIKRKKSLGYFIITILNSFYFAIGFILLISCSSYHKISYLQVAENLKNLGGQSSEVRIIPKDNLYITLSTIDPNVAVMYNWVDPTVIGEEGGLGNSGALHLYLVDNDGFINFPLVGKIKVSGLTKQECEDTIRNKLLPYLSENEDPIVTIQMESWKISVLGEVERPGIYMVRHLTTFIINIALRQ